MLLKRNEEKAERDHYKERDKAHEMKNLLQELDAAADSDESNSANGSVYGSDSDDEEQCFSEWDVVLKQGGGRGSAHSLPFYLASLESVLSAMPEVVRTIQKVTINFIQEECPLLKMAGNWEDQLMVVRTLKVIL